MFRFLDELVVRKGVVGIVNYGAAVGLLASFLIVQFVRHGNPFSQMPTLIDLGLTLIGAMALWIVLGIDAWLAVRRFKRGRSRDVN